MDPFEVRMQFLTLLRRLSASQPSIQKVVGYSLKYYSRCGEDLWDCVIEECQKGDINHRINILYFLDSLCEACLLAKSHPASLGPENPNSSLYMDYVARDLARIVEYVVPEGRQGLPNLMSTKQILERWRSKRVIEPQKVDEIMSVLNARRTAQESSVDSCLPSLQFSKTDVFRRIEEDRERHKRLRERRWVQPVSHNPHSHLQPQLASFLPLTDDGDGEGELTIDIEFDNEWETTSDWNEDDDEAATEENELCFPGDNEEEKPMDLS